MISPEYQISWALGPAGCYLGFCFAISIIMRFLWKGVSREGLIYFRIWPANTLDYLPRYWTPLVSPFSLFTWAGQDLVGMELDGGMNLVICLALLGPTWSTFNMLRLSPHDPLHLVFLKQSVWRVMVVCCGETVDRLIGGRVVVPGDSSLTLSATYKHNSGGQFGPAFVVRWMGLLEPI